MVRSLWFAKQQQLKRSTLPILVGPFRGEVGFEVLYWIPFLRRLVKRLNIDPARQLGITKYQTLHPGWMFARLGPYFDSHMGLYQLEQEALFDPLVVPAIPNGLALPEKFVAVRFYLRYTFQAHPQMIQFAQESIRQIAQQTPVVLLNSGLHLDDHIDI